MSAAAAAAIAVLAAANIGMWSHVVGTWLREHLPPALVEAVPLLPDDDDAVAPGERAQGAPGALGVPVSLERPTRARGVPPVAGVERARVRASRASAAAPAAAAAGSSGSSSGGSRSGGSSGSGSSAPAPAPAPDPVPAPVDVDPPEVPAVPADPEPPKVDPPKAPTLPTPPADPPVRIGNGRGPLVEVEADVGL